MAHWIIEDHGFAGAYYKCSDCGEIYTDLFDDKKINKGYCPSCTQQINDDENEYVDNTPKFTNLNYIHSLSSSDLATLLTQTHEESEYDYDWDENLIDTGFTRLYYVTSDGERFEDGYYNDAIAHEIEWLNAEYKENKND